jgi:hypothetical protein
VLSDPAFRALLRRDPAAAAREMGVEPADEAAGSPLETLELRESKSSLAGALLAAAIEGVAVYEAADHVIGGSVPAAQAATPQPEPLAGDDAGAESDDGGAVEDAGDSEDGGDDEGADDNEDDEEDEPDEEEPDEVGPDQDDLTDDEVLDPEGDGGDDSDDGADSDDGSDSDDESDSGDGADADAGADNPDDHADSAGNDAPPDLGDIDGAYPGDDASQKKVALWMAAESQRRGLPPELPVMAALVESGLRNLPGGDADSVGFFQMRASIWNQGDYAGYAGDPKLQLDWFLDHAKAVRDQRVAAGLPVDDPDGYGDWIADVERPAEQYRGRYQLRLDEARELLDRPSGGDVPVPSGELRAGPEAREAVAEARRFLGTPYQWGGSTPQTGFDCSGLVQWAYAQAGIRIPRVTHEQILADNATKVGRNHLLPGDLVFFRDSTGYVHHVGISLGGDRFLHAPHTGDVVKISSLKEPYYAEQFTGARRFDDPVSAARPRASASANALTQARAALDRDAAEVSRPGTALHQAVELQESHNRNAAGVFPVIRPDQVKPN